MLNVFYESFLTTLRGCDINHKIHLKNLETMHLKVSLALVCQCLLLSAVICQ